MQIFPGLTGASGEVNGQQKTEKKSKSDMFSLLLGRIGTQKTAGKKGDVAGKLQAENFASLSSKKAVAKDIARLLEKTEKVDAVQKAESEDKNFVSSLSFFLNLLSDLRQPKIIGKPVSKTGQAGLEEGSDSLSQKELYQGVLAEIRLLLQKKGVADSSIKDLLADLEQARQSVTGKISSRAFKEKILAAWKDIIPKTERKAGQPEKGRDEQGAVPINVVKNDPSVQGKKHVRPESSAQQEKLLADIKLRLQQVLHKSGVATSEAKQLSEQIISDLRKLQFEPHQAEKYLQSRSVVLKPLGRLVNLEKANKSGEAKRSQSQKVDKQADSDFFIKGPEKHVRPAKPESPTGNKSSTADKAKSKQSQTRATKDNLSQVGLAESQRTAVSSAPMDSHRKKMTENEQDREQKTDFRLQTRQNISVRNIEDMSSGNFNDQENFSSSRQGQDMFAQEAGKNFQNPSVPTSTQSFRIPAHPVARQIEQTAFRNIQPGTRQLVLQLEPVALGAVMVMLRVNKDKEVHAVLRAGSQEAARVIGEQAQQLRQSLEAQGLKVSRLEVRHEADMQSGADFGPSQQNRQENGAESGLKGRFAWSNQRSDGIETNVSAVLEHELQHTAYQENFSSGVDIFA